VRAISSPGADEGGADGVAIDGRLASQIHQAAVDAAQQVVRNPKLAVTCRPGEDERSCARGFIDRFAARAFRRPLAATERDRLLALFDLGRAQGFGAGVGLVVQAALQSADFLYRTELGSDDPAAGGVRPSIYERAAMLSFFLLESVPDEELWRTATTGALANPGALEAQVARLLSLPRAQESLVGVLSHAFGLHRVLTSETMAAGFDEALRRSMHDEARRFLQAVLLSGGTVRDLFTSRQTHADARMAQLYGLPASGAARSLAADRWSGILTRPGVVAGLRAGNRSVFRGLFVRSHALCERLPAPPGDLDTAALERLESARTERQKVAVRAGTPACAGCHALIDPMGLALEHYDEIGRYVTSREGAAVDASGELRGTDVDGPFGNAVELSDRLGRSRAAAACVARHLTAAATGRRVHEPAACPDRSVPDPATATLMDAVRAIATGPRILERNATGGQP
jgi:hypothetical protein